MVLLIHMVMVVTLIITIHHGVVVMMMMILYLVTCAAYVVVEKAILNLHHVKTKVYGIVVMANVSHQVMYVMDQLTPVTQVGVLTVIMAQMKV
jgi:hypothetical protein